MRFSRELTLCVVCVGVLVVGGCEPQQDSGPPPIPERRDVPPQTPVEPEPVPEAPAPQPMPAPEPAPPQPKYTTPSITWHMRSWENVEIGRQRGAGFTLTYTCANPDNLSMRVSIRDNRGDVITVNSGQVGNIFGVEHFVPGATAAGAPYYARIEWLNPDDDEWVPLFDYSPIEQK